MRAFRDAGERASVLLALAILGIGIGIRIAQYVARRSLRPDEAMLSLNIAARPTIGLLHPLDYAQSAPPLFLWGEHALVRIAGGNELSLRAIPLITGILLLPAVWFLARGLAGMNAALPAIAIAVLSPFLTYYANEVKPYGPDAFVTVLLVACVVRVLDSPGEVRRWRVMALTGAIAVWASSPAIFVLASVLAALAASTRVRRAPDFPMRIGGTALLWGASFTTVYATVLRHASGDAYLQWFFEGTFLTPTAPHFVTALQVAVGSILNNAFLHRDLFDAAMPSALYAFLALALALCVVGVVAIGRWRGPSAAILLVGPILVAFGASGARLYPSTPARLMGFAFPLLAIAAAAGLVAVTRKLPARVRPFALAALTLLFLLPSGYHALKELRDPYGSYENARTPILTFDRSPQSKEPVYVPANAVPEWLFYTTDWGAPDTARLAFYARASRSPNGPAKQNAPSRRRAVSREGGDLTWVHHGRREVVGLFSGVASRPVYERTPPVPDDGWARNEAERIRAAAQPCLTVMNIESVYLEEIEPLYRALERLGARSMLFTRAGPTHRLQRVCFDSEGAGAAWG